MAGEILVDGDSLAQFCSELLQRVGVQERHAKLAAEVQVEADLRGVYSHGSRAIPRYIRDIQAGRTNPRPDIRLIKDGPTFALFDADRALGQVVSPRAMGLAIEKAKETTIACTGVLNSNHYGAAAYYAMMAVGHDMIGFTTTTGSGCNMAAFGGVTPIVGNLPIAYAIPAGEELPLVLDMATGVVAMGKVQVARTRGQEIPLGWAMTQEGRSTTDPHEATIVIPLGYKGYGLALIMDALGGVLLGEVASCLKQERSPDQPSSLTHLFMAIDIASFRPVRDFKRDMDAMVRTVHASQTQPGVQRVFLPGEIEWLRKEKTLRLGIPFWPEDLVDLEEMGGELGVMPPWKA